MKNKLLYLFKTFFKIGLFTFGGGYAMISLLENEFVSKKEIIKKEDFIDIIAISESTPGPIAVNTATYIGYKINGILGSLISTIAVSLPSFIIMYIISLFLDKFLSFKYINYAFSGIQVCVIYLIFMAAFNLIKSIKLNKFNKIMISLLTFTYVILSILSKNFSSIIYIIISALIGIIIFRILKIKEGDIK